MIMRPMQSTIIYINIGFNTLCKWTRMSHKVMMIWIAVVITICIEYWPEAPCTMCSLHNAPTAHLGTKTLPNIYSLHGSLFTFCHRLSSLDDDWHHFSSLSWGQIDDNWNYDVYILHQFCAIRCIELHLVSITWCHWPPKQYLVSLNCQNQNHVPWTLFLIICQT